MRRRRSVWDYPPRILLAGAVTLLAVLALAWTQLSSGGGGQVRVEGATEQSSTSAARTGSTTAPPKVSIDPSWPAKGVSRYSESVEGIAPSTVPITAPTTTVALPAGPATSGRGGSSTTATTTSRPVLTAPRYTAPALTRPPAPAPVTAAPTVPATTAPTTAPPPTAPPGAPAVP